LTEDASRAAFRDRLALLDQATRSSRPPDSALVIPSRARRAIYFSAFFSLVFQIRGLIGLEGILPASRYLHAVEQSLGHWQRVWYAPTLLWFSRPVPHAERAVLGGDVGLAAALS